VDQLVPFQLRTLHKCFPTFSTHMNPGSMSVKVFPHCWIITKHLGASLVRARYCPVHSITHLFFHFHLVARSRIIKYTTCCHASRYGWKTFHILRHATTQNICRYKHNYMKNTVKLAFYNLFWEIFTQQRNFWNLIRYNTNTGFNNMNKQCLMQAWFFPQNICFMAILTKNPFHVKLTNIKLDHYNDYFVKLATCQE
jgi:hypothetical protein